MEFAGIKSISNEFCDLFLKGDKSWMLVIKFGWWKNLCLNPIEFSCVVSVAGEHLMSISPFIILHNSNGNLLQDIDEIVYPKKNRKTAYYSAVVQQGVYTIEGYFFLRLYDVVIIHKYNPLTFLKR